MGLAHSAWAVAALPAHLLIGFAFAGAGMAATTFMRSWQHFEFITLATLPMFLFSTTFLPAQRLPPADPDRGGVHAPLSGRDPWSAP